MPNHQSSRQSSLLFPPALAGQTRSINIETVHITSPDLHHRSSLDRTRSRLVLTSTGFAVLFMALIIKLADATIFDPVLPRQTQNTIPASFAKLDPDQIKRVGDSTNVTGNPAGGGHPFGNPVGNNLSDTAASAPHVRASITDRNGQILAVSLPTAAVYANPQEMMNIDDVIIKLKRALPSLDTATIRQRLTSGKQFVYLARQITPRDELRINGLGIPGIYFETSERRRYPMGRTAAQVLGGVDVDGHGVAGVEKFFEERLSQDTKSLQLSLDVRVQSVVHDELLAAMNEFKAIGGCGIIMDVNTGEVISMVSLPDYDANDFGHTKPDDRFNRAVTGMYEPGSTFKLQTASMALDSGLVHLWNQFDASHDIHIGRFTISDFEGKHRWLYLPEVLAYSSNLGAAHIAELMGAERQRNWLRQMGMFGRVGIELPEEGMPIVPSASNWKEIATMTIGFGHGIAVSPLHVVRGTAAIANGGILLRPTIIAQPQSDHQSDNPLAQTIAASQPQQAQVIGRVMKPSTSDMMRKLMRLVVTDGFGKAAEVPGYYPGGKTGTAEKVGAHGYRKHTNVAAFMSVFPMNAPRYAVYMMLDEPHADASTHGYATAGWVVAPATGRVIARIGPMLGLLPDLQDKAVIDASLYMPLVPSHPTGAHTAVSVSQPVSPEKMMVKAAKSVKSLLPMAPSRPVHDFRHEALLTPPPAMAAMTSLMPRVMEASFALPR